MGFPVCRGRERGSQELPGKGEMVLTLTGHSTWQVCSPWNLKAPKHWAEDHTYLQATPCQLHIGRGQRKACGPPAVAHTHVSHHTLVQIQYQDRAPPPNLRLGSEAPASLAGRRRAKAATKGWREQRRRAEASRTSQGEGGSACRGRANSSGQPTSETAGPPGCAQSFRPQQRPPLEAG